MIDRKIFAGLVVFGSIAVHAEEYQAELGIGYGKKELDSLDSSNYNFNGAYYFGGVETKNKPLGEAAFLNRASSISASYFEADGIFVSEKKEKNVAAEFYISKANLYLGAEYNKSELLYSSPVDDNKADYLYSIGLTPLDGFLIKTTYIQGEDYDANLQAKYVFGFGKNKALNIEASYTDSDETDTYFIASDYYFSNATSIGLSHYDFGDKTKSEYRVKHFITSKAFVGASYVEETHIKGFNINAGFRF